MELALNNSITAPEPATDLKKRLHTSVLGAKTTVTPWEMALYTLIAAKMPGAAVTRVALAFPQRKKSLDKLDLLNTMTRLDFYPRSFSSTLDSLDTRLSPCLAIIEDTPIIILQQRGDDLIVYNSASEQSEQWARDDARLKNKVECWIFEVFDENKTATSKFMRQATRRSWFSSLLSRFRPLHYQVFILSLLLNLSALASPLFIMTVYDKVLGTGAFDTLVMLTIGMILALCMDAVFRHYRTESLAWMTARLDNIVGAAIFSHIINLKPAYIERASIAGQIARIRTFETIREFFTGSLFLSVIELPFMALSLLVIYILGGSLFFIVLAMAGVYLVLYAAMRHFFAIQIRKAAKASSTRQQFVIETFDKLAAIRANGLTQIWQHKFQDLCGRDMMTHFRMQWLTSTVETATTVLSSLTMMILISSGVHYIWAGQLTTGGLIATMLLVWRVLNPLYSLCLSIPRIEQLRSSLSQINDLMDLEDEDQTAMRLSRLPTLRGKITFDTVSMRYSEHTGRVFEKLSFTVNPGEVMAIVGGNGAGKSSLLKMVQDLYGYESGVVYLDGFDMRQLDAHDVRTKIAYVPQVQEFFEGSVYDNLRLTNPLATEEAAWGALKLANAESEVAAMPDGIHTILQHNGRSSLSPSLSIKLSLARAYIQNASVILIDELPNGLLNGDLGLLLRDYISSIKGKATVLFVTYRDDMLQLADHVLWLRRHEEAVFGSRADMIKKLQQTGGNW